MQLWTLIFISWILLPRRDALLWVYRKFPPKDIFPRKQFIWLTNGDRVGIQQKNPYVNEQEKKGRSNGLSKRYSLVTKHAKTKANHACRKVLNTTTSGFWQRKIPTVFTLFRNNKLTLTTIALAFVWRAMSLLFKSFFYPKPAALKFRLVNSSRPPTACFWTTW